VSQPTASRAIVASAQVRAAVLSDIHGNLYALQAVLAAVDEEAVDAIWCLGDLVGYGPRPTEVTAEIEERATLCLAGNHDLGVIAGDLLDFSDEAAAAAHWTREVLSPAARTYLESLESSAVADCAELFHGSPRDPVWEYVVTGESALDALLRTTAQVVLVGHSHLPIAIQLDDDVLEGGLVPDGHRAELDGARWLLNPGSVGQPRDGDPRAAFLVLDFDAAWARFRRIPYPVERTQAEIREHNLPDSLADRLADGV